MEGSVVRDHRDSFPDTDFPAPGIDTIALAAGWARDHFADLDALADGPRRLTFSEYVNQARAVARGLIAAGVDKGDRVALWAPNSIEFAVTALGIHIAGAVLVPVNTRFKVAEVDFILTQANIKVSFSVEAFLGVRYADILAALWSGDPEPPRLVILDQDGDRGLAKFLSGGAGVDDRALDDRVASITGPDIASILFTSGTTGRPKGAMLRHAALMRGYWTWSGAAGIRRGDRYLCSNPFFHAFGLKAGLLSALMRGVTIYPVAVFNPERALEIIEHERITYYPGPPTVFQAMLHSPDLERSDISSLRASVIGATALPPALIRAMYDRLGFEEIHCPYGFTEGSALATVTVASDDPEIVATTAGRPLRVLMCASSVTMARTPPRARWVRLSSTDTTMRRLSGPGNWRGSSGRRSGDLHSGDLGELDEHGYLRIRGRIKDMYIVGGFNVYPTEVESCLLEMPGVLAVAVTGVPDERLGEAGRAFVVLEPHCRLEERDVIEWCRSRIANFKVPRTVVFASHLPVNASGKVIKSELPGIVRQWPAGDGQPTEVC